MATTNFGTNHAAAVKLWSRKMFQEALRQTWLYRFIGNDDNSLIQILDDTQKGPGDRITVPLRMQLTQLGVQGDGTLEGSEESLTIYTDNLFINQLRHAVRSAGKMSEQRVPFSVREQAQKALSDWWANVFDLGGFNQLCGISTADTRQAGNNTPTNPVTLSATDYVVVQPATSTASCGSTAYTMQLSYIDRAVELAKTRPNNPIRPIKMNGESYYVCFMHPYQAKSLRINTNTGQWLDIQKAAMQGGEISKNPIFTGALGMYNNVILHESTRVAADPNVANVYRAVLCGAQAAVLSFGQDNDGNKVSWVEELFDYGNQLGVSGGMIFGLKKTVFNNIDFGVITIYTYGAAGAN